MKYGYNSSPLLHDNKLYVLMHRQHAALHRQVERRNTLRQERGNARQAGKTISFGHLCFFFV